MPPTNPAPGEERSKMKYLILSKDGWPVERIIGKPINYIIRCLIWGRAVTLKSHWDRMWKAEAQIQRLTGTGPVTENRGGAE